MNPDHPWERFLNARIDAIMYLYEEGYDDEKIASILSMYANQVTVIRSGTARLRKKNDQENKHG